MKPLLLTPNLGASQIVVSLPHLVEFERRASWFAITNKTDLVPPLIRILRVADLKCMSPQPDIACHRFGLVNAAITECCLERTAFSSVRRAIKIDLCFLCHFQSPAYCHTRIVLACAFILSHVLYLTNRQSRPRNIAPAALPRAWRSPFVSRRATSSESHSLASRESAISRASSFALCKTSPRFSAAVIMPTSRCLSASARSNSGWKGSAFMLRYEQTSA